MSDKSTTHSVNDEMSVPAAEQVKIAAHYKGRYSGPESSYKLAFADEDFLTSPEMRGVRMQLEISKPDLVFRKERVKHTITVFGSARFLPPSEAQDMLAQAKTDDEIKKAKLAVKNSIHYQKAFDFGRIVGSRNVNHPPEERLVICTGGGPGIMSGANAGASAVNDMSAGMNIALPFEQEPNAFITPALCFDFHYFSSRKFSILSAGSSTPGFMIEKSAGFDRSKVTENGGGSVAIVGFAGGYGTLDEVFESLTLIQTGKMRERPVILVGKEYWNNFMNLQYLADEGAISPEDVHLISIVDTAEEAWEVIRSFYGIKS